MRAKNFLLVFFVVLMGLSGSVSAKTDDTTPDEVKTGFLPAATTKDEEPQRAGSKLAQGLQNVRNWTGVAYNNYLFAAKIIVPTITVFAQGLRTANYKEYAEFLTSALTVAKGAGEFLRWSDMLLGLAVNQL